MTNPAIILKQIRLFARVAELHREGEMVLNEHALEDSVRALSQFASGYAFERQGRSPSYGPIAADVIEKIGKLAGSWENTDSPIEVWNSFCTELYGLAGNAKPNPKVNPLCYKGYSYETKHGRAQTNQPSVVEFSRGLKAYDHNLVAWAKNKLEQGEVSDAHGQLRGINGIGPKIASLFLRDVAWRFDISAAHHHALLQPVDVWVRRAVQRMDPTASAKCGEWIVKRVQEASVLPEAVNAGLWYLGAVIAGSEYAFFKVLDSPEWAQRKVEDHVRNLDKRVRTWRQWQSGNVS